MRTSILVSVFSAMVMMVYSTSVQAKEYTIKMISKGAKEAYYYDPKKITIKSGDTVTWINTQDEVHNVMTSSVPENAEFFTSPDLEKKDQKWSYTFTVPGTYNYHCHPHASIGMVGTIIVDHPSNSSALKEDEHHHDHEEHTDSK